MRLLRSTDLALRVLMRLAVPSDATPTTRRVAGPLIGAVTRPAGVHDHG